MTCTRVLALTLTFAAFAPLSSAQDGFRGWGEIKDPDWRFDPDRHVFHPYFVGDVNVVRELFEKWEALRSEGALVPALRELQQLLDQHGASALQVAEDRYVGAAEYARFVLLHAAPEVRAAYDKMAETNARAAFDTARADGDLFALRRLARRYANAHVGREALLTMARLHRERGDRELAAFHARRLLDFVDPDGGDAADAALAAEARAIVALGSGTTRGLVDDATASKAAVTVAGRSEPLARFLAESDVKPPRLDATVWPTFGGDWTRARRCEPPLHELDLSRTFELPIEAKNFEGALSPLADLRHTPIQPIRLGDRLLVGNSLSVRCFDLLARSLVWEWEGPQTRVRGQEDDGFLRVGDYSPRRRDGDDYTFSKGLVVGLSAGRGVALANVQIPLSQVVKTLQGNRINDPCPVRELVALDAETGALQWEQRPLRKNPVTGRLEYQRRPRRGDPEGVVSRLDVPSPPVVVDGVVYALGHFFEGAVNTYLVALDLESGEPLYTVPLVIGQEELSMFNMPFQEFTLGPPSFADGTLYASTNVGLVAAVDAAFGDLRWLSAYRSLEIRQPENYYRNQPRPVYWYSRGPLVTRSAVLFTPHDSSQLLALDPATGKERWTQELRAREGGDGHPTCELVGVSNERAIVAGGEGDVRAIDVESGLNRWVKPLFRRGPRGVELLGTGCIAGDEIWLPTTAELVVFDGSADPQRAGTELRRLPWPTDDARSVLVFPDMVVVSSRTSVDVVFDPAEALRGLEAEVRRRGESLDLLTRIGGLQRQAGELELAAETLRRALERGGDANSPEVVRARAARCATLRELAQREKSAGRAATAESALVAAEAVADDPESRAAVVRELVDSFASDAHDDRALRWLERLRDDFGSARVVVPELSTRAIPIAVQVGLELARRRERRGEFELALAELQRLQSDWPAESIGERDSGSVAQEAVEALLAHAPPAVRRKYDADAQSSFESAAAAGDVERLSLLLRRYPAASATPAFAARELELLRSAGRNADAMAMAAEVLRGRPDKKLLASTLGELARAARDVGNESLARTAVKRLAVGGERVADDLVPLADAPKATPAAGHALEPAGDLTLGDADRLVGGSDYPLRGEPLPAGFESTLVYEPGLETAISRLHLPDGTKRWTVQLERPRVADYVPQLVHVGGVLVAKRGPALQAFDLETGSPLWRHEFPRDVPEISAAGGVLLASQRTPPTEGREAEPVQVVFLEPRTGRELATATLAGTNTQTGSLGGVGASCVALSLGRRGTLVEVFDALSGARRLDPRPCSQWWGGPLLVESQGLLLVTDARPQSGGTGGGQRVVALRLGSGEKAFDVDLLPLQYKLKEMAPVAEGVALRGGSQPNGAILVVDPKSGQLVGGPRPLPKEVADAARPLPVTSADGTVELRGFAEWRKGDPLQMSLLTGSGKPLWRQGFDLPKNTVAVLLPDRLLRVGDDLLFELATQAGGKCRTELVVVDVESGKVIDRKAFEGGRPGQRDDLVECDDWVALRQEHALHVLRWR
jgi:outer membrane protein assembly factor BamB/tetratricopeptide (TPR) repeat protein